MSAVVKLKPCRRCGGPKDSTLPRWQRGWYCSPCEQQVVEQNARRNSRCGNCTDRLSCPECREIRRKLQCEAARRATVTRRANQAGYFRPLDAERYWQGKAHNTVKSAVRRGLLPDLMSGEYACVDCAGVAHEYDHRDYSRPLDVEPVCRSCNKRRGTAKWPSADNYQFAKYNEGVSNAA